VEVDFTPDGVLIAEVLPGSPACTGNLQRGDELLAVDGTLVSTLTPEELVLRMRGAPDSTVQLTLRRGTEPPRHVQLTRQHIELPSVHSRWMQGDILYIQIRAFQEGTASEFLAALGAARQSRGKAPSGVLLDLRNNPGGLVREATALCDEFLDSGVIYSLRARGEEVRTVRAQSSGALLKTPLVVLVDARTASAAELLSAALQDHGRARVVGTTTFGKGSVQTLLPLPGGAALKLTTALYATPHGRLLQSRGVSPDFRVEAEARGPERGALLREQDLRGALPGTDTGTSTPPPPLSLLPTTDDELRAGVARVIPEQPLGSRDRALSAGYSLLATNHLPAPR